jgi:hypothetical protein
MCCHRAVSAPAIPTCLDGSIWSRSTDNRSGGARFETLSQELSERVPQLAGLRPVLPRKVLSRLRPDRAIRCNRRRVPRSLRHRLRMPAQRRDLEHVGDIRQTFTALCVEAPRARRRCRVGQRPRTAATAADRLRRSARREPAGPSVRRRRVLRSPRLWCG